jgi:hypothetical protein
LGSGIKVAAPHLPRLKYFEGMKMMNGMMRMNGTMNDMGMNMSMQQMDMNMVMYPEITGDINAHHPVPKNDTMQEKQQSEVPKEHSSKEPSEDIVSLNYAMLKAPFNTALPGTCYEDIAFQPHREYETGICGHWIIKLWERPTGF